MRSLLTRMHAEEGGFGLVLVIGTATVVSSMVLLGTTMAMRSLTSSRQHVGFEGAIAAAESGIDAALARAQKAYDGSGSDSYVYPTASEAACPFATPDWATSGGPGTAADSPAAIAAERQWAKTQLLTIAAVPACRAQSSQGEFVFFKPLNHQAVYAMGWSPSYSSTEAKMRYLKAEYLFTPYAPSQAVLTGGDLHIDSSTTVDAAPPNDPSVAGVHANGRIVVGSGNPQVSGTVSQSDLDGAPSSNKFLANVGGAVSTSAQQGLPTVSAAEVWTRQHAGTHPGGWYDLCLDGSVRFPDAGAPCLGTIQTSLVAGGSFRGWSYNAATIVPTWTASSALKTNGYSGAYYVTGNVTADAGNAGADVPNLTVIAAAVGVGCAKVGGSIDWRAIDIAAPAIPSLFLFADADLRTGSNFHAGSAEGGAVVSGLFVAGDQIQMETSSSGVYGAVLAADQCTPSGSLVSENLIKNPAIHFDPNAKAPFVGLVNTTLWLEYTG